MGTYLGIVQDLDWASPSRIFATTTDLFNHQPNYEHEVAIALDTNTKYQGVAPVVGGWGYATGAPGPYPPVPDPPPVNDSFTKLLLEFEGIEGSTTYKDTNAAGVPRIWTQITGSGCITNEGELFDEGALKLDGQTVITAPDSVDFNFRDQDFTIRGNFLCDFPVGAFRTLAAKTDRQPSLAYVFRVDNTSEGHLLVGVGIDRAFSHRLLDRFDVQIIDRAGEIINTNFGFVAAGEERTLESTTVYSDTINPGWHEFVFTRHGSILELKLDGVLEDTEGIGIERVLPLPGPITIGGYGPPINGGFSGNPWIGRLDRFAIDFGVAR